MPKNAIEVTIAPGDIQNIPMPKLGGANLQMPTHAELRVVVFDTIRKVYLSNFVIVAAKPIDLKSQQTNFCSSTWKIDEIQKSFVACTENTDTKAVHLVFEFAVYCQL
jgi:hypothetical protein